jgi:hypothetical protein
MNALVLACCTHVPDLILILSPIAISSPPLLSSPLRPALPPCPAEEEQRVVALSYDALVVRLNSVQHLLDSLGGLERMVVERWDDGRPRSAKAREGAHAYDWVAGMFDGARRAAGRTRDHLARFIGVKVGWGLAWGAGWLAGQAAGSASCS